MTNKKINVIILIMVVFIVLFFSITVAYDSYLLQKQDSAYEQTENNGDYSAGESSQDNKK
jgi:hypothetical protein